MTPTPTEQPPARETAFELVMLRLPRAARRAATLAADAAKCSTQCSP